MPTAAFPPIAQLLPHRNTMCLLDAMSACGDGWIETQLTIRENLTFLEDGFVGARVGLEYMAQSVAAYAGWQAFCRGEPVRIGLLVGTRAYESRVPAYPLHELLRVRVEHRFETPNGVGSFFCTIRGGDGCLAEATLTVYQPGDDAAILHGSNE